MVALRSARCYTVRVMEDIALQEQPSAEPAADPEMTAMLAAGVHLGHSRRKHNPGMAPYVWGVRASVEIIDLTKTKEKLAVALAFLGQAAREGKLLLFVGTRPSVRSILRQAAEELGSPYVDQRWIGGTLTNFKVISKRIETLETLEAERVSGGWEKYTKKEQLMREREIERLRANFDGLRRMRKLPQVLVIVDIQHDDLALREARRLGIPVVALTDTNSDPRLVDYPIPANDDARSAVAYMLTRMTAAIRAGQAAAAAAAVPPPSGEESWPESPPTHD